MTAINPQEQPDHSPQENIPAPTEMDDFAQKVEKLWKFSHGQLNSIQLFHRIGYGIVLLSFLDYITQLYPLNFGNAGWEFQTMGALIEQAVVPLIGFALVFYGGTKARNGAWEKPVLKIASWVTLVVAIAHLIFLPWGILNTLKIDGDIKNQVAERKENTSTGAANFQEALAQAQTPEDLQRLISILDPNSPIPEISPEEVDTVKERLEELAGLSVNQSDINLSESQGRERRRLYEQSFKWSLGTVVVSALFFLIWQSSAWARKRR